MVMRRCEAGEHTFDDSLHSSCPYCRKTRLATPPGGVASPPGGVTVPVGGVVGVPQDIPPLVSPPPMPDKTTPAPGMMGAGYSSGGTKTRVVFGGDKAADFGEVMPVVGWLVVIGGPGQGRDVRITPGMNTIGRESGGIVLNFGDESISREKHAMLAYDPDGNSFMIAHGDGKNLTKVNGRTLMSPQELGAYDRIRMGNTEMVFVPLCGQDFSWSPPNP